MNKQTKVIWHLLVLIIFFLQVLIGNAQDSIVNRNDSNVYKPYSQRMRMEEGSIVNSDTLLIISSVEQDSINSRLQFIQDSIAIREQFIRDSILVREQFVRDSLFRRKQILDSVSFLKTELPYLLGASINTINDDIILFSNKIAIVGDSILNNYSYIKLPNRFNQPYTPWNAKINLSTKPPLIEIDVQTKRIKSIKSPNFNNMFSYKANKEVIIISQQGRFSSKYSKKYYKAPIDSIFFDNSGRVIKIKRYYKVYSATDNYQLGSVLFNFLWQVKQYAYNGNNLSSYEIIKFCDRWAKQDLVKVCNKSNYKIEKQGFSYVVNRTNDPANKYSDGTYKYEFDNLYNLKNVTFRNTTNSENWKTFIELNPDGNVSRYVYQDKGIVNRTLLVNYYLTNPTAKHKVETVTCTFEDDGISYFQHNNTTEKSRIRDHFTAEWGPWH